jgi:hypothetical protein
VLVGEAEHRVGTALLAGSQRRAPSLDLHGDRDRDLAVERLDVDARARHREGDVVRLERGVHAKERQVR